MNDSITKGKYGTLPIKSVRIETTRATRTRKQGTLVYGFRITLLKDGYKSITLPTIFSADTPELWYQLCNDQAVLSARLHRRGKLVDQYSKVVRP